jgi:hypothetical protein
LARFSQQFEGNMNADVQPEPNGAHQDISPARTGRLMLVRCERSTCLAYYSAGGRWVSYFDRKELTDVLEVMSPEAQTRF